MDKFYILPCSHIELVCFIQKGIKEMPFKTHKRDLVNIKYICSKILKTIKFCNKQNLPIPLLSKSHKFGGNGFSTHHLLPWPHLWAPTPLVSCCCNRTTSHSSLPFPILLLTDSEARYIWPYFFPYSSNMSLTDYTFTAYLSTKNPMLFTTVEIQLKELIKDQQGAIKMTTYSSNTLYSPYLFILSFPCKFYSILPAVLALECLWTAPCLSQSWHPGLQEAIPHFLVFHPSHPDCLKGNTDEILK